MALFTDILCTAYFNHYHPTGFGYDVCKPLHTAGARVLNEWVLHYVFSGTGVFQTKDNVYHPKAGDMFIIRPNEWVYYAADENDPWTYAWFDFHSDDLPAAVLQRDMLSEPRLGRVFMSTYKQSASYASEERDAFLYGKLSELFGLLELLYPAEEKPSSNRLIHEAIQFMNNNYPQHITVEDVAKHVHMEYYHFISFFRRSVGIPPGKYLTNLRLSAGTGWLLHYDISTKKVAEGLGYNDTDTFSRAFKKQYGLSPQQYTEKYGVDAHRWDK